MKTYWDYTEQERAWLTSDQVTSILDVELMTAGVLKPKAPVLEEVPQNPVGPRQKFYGVEVKGKYASLEHVGIVFSRSEDAEKFLALNPCVRTYDYEVGSDFTYVNPLSDAKISVEEIYSISQINDFRSVLKRRKASAESNEKLTSKFKDACSKAETITEKVWSDWYSQCQTKNEMANVVSTYKEYLNLTGGDVRLALTFLNKAIGVNKVDLAREWFPSEIQNPSQLVAVEESPVAV